MNKMRLERIKLKVVEFYYVFSYKIFFIINS